MSGYRSLSQFKQKKKKEKNEQIWIPTTNTMEKTVGSEAEENLPANLSPTGRFCNGHKPPSPSCKRGPKFKGCACADKALIVLPLALQPLSDKGSLNPGL